MAAGAAVIVLLSLLSASVVGQSRDTNASLLSVVGALEKLLAFYKSEYHHMNLDGIFGLKVVEGWSCLLQSGSHCMMLTDLL